MSFRVRRLAAIIEPFYPNAERAGIRRWAPNAGSASIADHDQEVAPEDHK